MSLILTKYTALYRHVQCLFMLKNSDMQQFLGLQKHKMPTFLLGDQAVSWQTFWHVIVRIMIAAVHIGEALVLCMLTHWAIFAGISFICFSFYDKSEYLFWKKVHWSPYSAPTTRSDWIYFTLKCGCFQFLAFSGSFWVYLDHSSCSLLLPVTASSVPFLFHSQPEKLNVQVFPFFWGSDCVSGSPVHMLHCANILP